MFKFGCIPPVVLAFLILFVGLKLCEQIDWSWWWVLSPAWIGGPLCVVAIFVAVLYAEIARNR